MMVKEETPGPGPVSEDILKPETSVSKLRHSGGYHNLVPDDNADGVGGVVDYGAIQNSSRPAPTAEQRPGTLLHGPTGGNFSTSS
eukprot:CAMPEP_0194287256 /NCGR_PEP_ID=MMETSP0169-20130528/34351_1 /TAXON_ID=218684 /ORGANISM="Corethron pennatum, Strain L29A3" /LENGTH=84 /DNA_ID=CAMNT_0039033899 /DNA_START=86 /DNA_END=336 /DNA_ORIENTATION=+